jgi:predicted O-methyltransferase YrrM
VKVGGDLGHRLHDVDKDGYPQMVELAYERLRKGGLFITDTHAVVGARARRRGRPLEGQPPA